MVAVDRKAILKEAIGRYPGISKTDLLKRVKDAMAKDTASRELADLEKDGKIIMRREGKKNRYFLRDAEEDRLNEDLAAALDGYVKELCAMKEEMGTYPYDLLNAFNNKIPEQRDELIRFKKRLEDELKFEHTVEDVMRDYNEIWSNVVKSLGIFQRLVDDNTGKKIRECMDVMSRRLKQKATTQFELRTKRKSLGKSKKRDSLTEEIEQLDSDIYKILVHAADLQYKLAHLKRITPYELSGAFAPHPVRWLQHVEEGRTKFQSLVEKALNAKTEGQDDEMKLWRDAEAGLKWITEQLSNMKGRLAKTEEAVITSYMDADLYKKQKELSLLVDEILEMYRS